MGYPPSKDLFCGQHRGSQRALCCLMMPYRKACASAPHKPTSACASERPFRASQDSASGLGAKARLSTRNLHLAWHCCIHCYRILPLKQWAFSVSVAAIVAICVMHRGPGCSAPLQVPRTVYHSLCEQFHEGYVSLPGNRTGRCGDVLVCKTQQQANPSEILMWDACEYSPCC